MSDPIPGKIPEEALKSSDEYSREEQGSKLIRFIDRVGAREIFKSEETKRQFLENLDFETFKDLLLSANAVLRDIPVKDRQTDGETVYLSGFVEEDYPPQHQDKEELLAKVFGNIKEMNESGKDIKDIGLLIGASINALHLFNDANGRTSRLAYSLLADNYDSELKDSDIQEILGEYGREVVDISPSILFINEIDPLIEDEVRDSVNPKPMWQRCWMEPDQIRATLVEKGVDQDNAEFMAKYCLHDRQGFLALEKYLSSKGILGDYVKSYVPEKPDRLDIVFDKVVEEVQAEDVERIKNEYWGIKKQRVEILIDMITNPERYPSRKDSNKTAKQYFEDKIDEKAKFYQDLE